VVGQKNLYEYIISLEKKHRIRWSNNMHIDTNSYIHGSIYSQFKATKCQAITAHLYIEQILFPW
jgi:hypothetical protein